MKCQQCGALITNLEIAWYKGKYRYCNGQCLTAHLRSEGDWHILRQEYLEGERYANHD